MILIDGDIVAYKCAYKSQEDREEYACYSASSYLSDLISELYIQIEDEPEYRVFLSGKGNFRNDIAVTAEYKGNRKNKPKPEHLQAIRQHMIDHWDAIVSEGCEADDLIATAATENPGSIIVSVDKDFDQVPGLHYNPNKMDLYTVNEEDAVRFLYEQILMGDRADNIIGLKGIGEKKAAKALEDCTTELEMYNKAVEMYGSVERVHENAKLLYLQRKKDDMWEPPNATDNEERT